MTAGSLVAPLILRGETIDEDLSEHGGRRAGLRFLAPAVARHLARLPLATPAAMADLHALSFDDIAGFLARLGARLELDRNPHLQAAFEMARRTSGLSDGVLHAQYEALPDFFSVPVVRALAENAIGLPYLEGWVEERTAYAPPVRVRAFGARSVHIIAGNAPGIAAATIRLNAITRSDALVKAPSNDPLTAAAIARTMIEIDPSHPLARHLSVAYWKGGDERIEDALYQPRHFEKIVAWGGLASVRHIARYIQPGIDLITLDPKLSAALVGEEAFASKAALADVADRLALDIGALDQEACFNARVVYAVTGGGTEGRARALKLAEMTYAALLRLPPEISAPHKAFDPELKAEIDALKIVGGDCAAVGGRANEGAILVSFDGRPVDFWTRLSGRVANIVAIEDVDQALRALTAATQTVGVYPETLMRALRDSLALNGAQRLTPLGRAALANHAPAPQDGIELARRLCKWIVEETAPASAREAPEMRLAVS